MPSKGNAVRPTALKEGSAQALPTSKLTSMHSSGSPFSSPDGNFYSQGVGSTFHPCGAKAAQLLGPWSFLMYGLVLEAEKMGFEGLQSGDEATLASHAKPQNTELVNEGYFIFSYSLPSLSKKSGGPNHFHSSV